MVSPVTAKMINFDNEDDLDVFYDALEYFDEEESGRNKTSNSQDNSSKNDGKESKAPIPPPVSMAPIPMAPVPFAFASSEKRKLEHAKHEEPTSSNSGVPNNKKPFKKFKVASKSRSPLFDNLPAPKNKISRATWPRPLREYTLKKKYQHDLLPLPYCGFQNEANICQAPAQVSLLDSRQRWQKQGSGTIVLDKDGDQARLVMLNDTTLRPILNLKLFFGMKTRVTDSNCIKIDAFNTVHDIYRRPIVKLMRYSLKFDNFQTANDICGRINHQTPVLPAAVPKNVLRDATNKDVSSIISRLMRANNPWKL